MANGGRRPGAGRPKGSLNKVKLVATDIAAQALASVDQVKVWRDLMESKDERIKLEALKYLSDRTYGKAPQSLRLQGDAEDPFRVIVEVIGA
jgi:hypothetical protein